MIYHSRIAISNFPHVHPLTFRGFGPLQQHTITFNSKIYSSFLEVTCIHKYTDVYIYKHNNSTVKHYSLILAHSGNLARAGKFFRAGRTFRATPFRASGVPRTALSGSGKPPTRPPLVFPQQYPRIVGSPPKHFGDWCSHTSGSEFISNETKSSWR